MLLLISLLFRLFALVFVLHSPLSVGDGDQRPGTESSGDGSVEGGNGEG